MKLCSRKLVLDEWILDSDSNFAVHHAQSRQSGYSISNTESKAVWVRKGLEKWIRWVKVLANNDVVFGLGVYFKIVPFLK